MRAFLSAILCCMLSLPLSAQTGALRQLNTGDDGRGWEAVGRLDMQDIGFCTGVLVEPDLVLTAAHCLYDKITGARVSDSDIQFQAGLRNGRASAYRAVKQSVIHPRYVFSAKANIDHVPNDVALLQLTRPIRNTQVIPFDTAGKPGKGAEISVVSYAHDRAKAPSLQEACTVMGRKRGVLVMSCSADFGSSGAPVFSFDGGVPRIVSLISAKAESGGTPVSLGTSLQEPLALLKVELRSRSRFKGLDANDRPKGAKFLRP